MTTSPEQEPLIGAIFHHPKYLLSSFSGKIFVTRPKFPSDSEGNFVGSNNPDEQSEEGSLLMKEFRQKHQYHLLTLALLLLVTGVSGYVVYSDKHENTENKKTQAVSPLSATNTTKEPKTQETINHQVKASNQQADSETETISVTLTVDDKTYTTNITANSTAYDLMKSLQNTVDFTFVGRDYGGALGFFVEEINDVRYDSQANKYWIYSINGQKAKVGISNYILKQGDIISWTYESAYE